MRTIIRRNSATSSPSVIRSETDLCEKVIAFLNQNGYRVWRQQNSGSYSTTQVASALVKWLIQVLRSDGLSWRFREPVDSKVYLSSKNQAVQKVQEILSSGWRKVPGSIKGVPDVIGFNTTGRMVVVEVKIGTDELSKEQKELMVSMKNSGCEVYLVREFDSFVKGFWSAKNQSATVSDYQSQVN